MVKTNAFKLWLQFFSKIIFQFIYMGNISLVIDELKLAIMLNLLKIKKRINCNLK